MKKIALASLAAVFAVVLVVRLPDVVVELVQESQANRTEAEKMRDHLKDTIMNTEGIDRVTEILGRGFDSMEIPTQDTRLFRYDFSDGSTLIVDMKTQGEGQGLRFRRAYAE